jgi:GTP cyclohydrolase I
MFKNYKALGTEDVACVIDAKHLCVNSPRGLVISKVVLLTSLVGRFKEPQTRREFLDYIKLDYKF